MEPENNSSDTRVQQFWARYISILKQFNVPEKAFAWYRKHVQVFIDAHPDYRLLEHTPEKLQRWFEKLGADHRIADWQFRQRVEALRLLFRHLLKTPWTDEF